MNNKFTMEEYLSEKRIIDTMNFSNEYDKMIDYIMLHHEGQVRKFDKSPYFYHPAKVAKTVELLTGSVLLTKAALAHDVVEDTPQTFKDIEANFGKDVAMIVQELTHNVRDLERKGKITMLIKAMIKMSDDALLIKLCDRYDNVSDFPTAPKKFVNKYRDETVTVLKNLEENRTLNSFHLKIVKKIKEILDAFA